MLDFAVLKVIGNTKMENLFFLHKKANYYFAFLFIFIAIEVQSIETFKDTIIDNEVTYEGDVAIFDGLIKPHGKGTQTYDLPEGKAIYKGDFANGSRHGQGTFIYPNGAKHEGGYKNSLRHGYGTFTYTCGTYQGNYENDKRNGQGTWTGMHCKGKKVSPFVLFNYTGGWKDDRIFGKGIHETPYQKVEGTFKENKHLYGPGRITYQKSRQRPKSGGTIIGEFEKGDLVFGTITTDDGDKLEVRCDKNYSYKLPHKDYPDPPDPSDKEVRELTDKAEGKLTYANGDVFVGSFSHSVCWGEGDQGLYQYERGTNKLVRVGIKYGKLTYQDGTIEDGFFYLGRLIFGTKILINGDKYTGIHSTNDKLPWYARFTKEKSLTFTPAAKEEAINDCDEGNTTTQCMLLKFQTQGNATSIQ